mmetsp:Transcript_28695/g.63196  ORF Transcript_28695/g.63196 Transcript_28695/m.63196 type:complete len:107 (-) Transcript_28695:2028-2348(-)
MLQQPPTCQLNYYYPDLEIMKFCCTNTHQRYAVCLSVPVYYLILSTATQLPGPTWSCQCAASLHLSCTTSYTTQCPSLKIRLANNPQSLHTCLPARKPYHTMLATP